MIGRYCRCNLWEKSLSGDSWCFLDNMQFGDNRQLQEILNKLERKEKE